MHYLQLIFVKAENKAEAKTKVEEFLTPYGEGLEWDWYEFGGRWSELGKIKKPDAKTLERVREMIERHAVDLEEERERARQILSRQVADPKDLASMDGYYLHKLGRMSYPHKYSNEFQVFDIEEHVANQVPEDLDGYFVAVVDLHN